LADRWRGIIFGPISLDAALTFGASLEKDSTAAVGSKPGWQPVFRTSPSLKGTLGYPASGRFAEFDYAASLQKGGRKQQDGSIDQVLSLAGYYGFAKLKVQMAADYSFMTGVDRDVGGNSDRSLLALELGAAYPLSVKSSLQSTIAASRSNYSEGISSDQVQGSIFFDRQASLKSRVGLGATSGAVHVDAGNDQTFQQIHLRGSYQPTPKFRVSASVGYEFRQVGPEDTATPILSGELGYQIRPTTSLQLALARSVSNSSIQRNSNYQSTTATLSVSQQLGPQGRASLAIGYQHASYDDSAETQDGFGSREDHYFFLRPNLSWRVGERLTLSLFYALGHNESNVRPFETQQLGLNGTLAF
jgi:hypothetical protein